MPHSIIKPIAQADTQSARLIERNIAQLKTLFPEAFKEGGIDFEVLKQLLGGQVDEREEKYGLNWHGKRRARQIALTPSTGTLRPCPGESVDWDTTQNLMIEGDNLEVLKLLQKSYAGKVKMIYIDPPYNTGKDFVYPDNFTDNIKNYLELTGQADGEGRKLGSNSEASGRFHTDWLNMMYPRLKLARNLLREDGVIFVSLDDGEIANLRQVLDDIFGAENFVATIIWEKKFSPQNDDKYLTAAHDYVVLYAKSIEHWEPNLLERTAEQVSAFSNLDDDPRGVWSSGDLTSKTKAAGHSYKIISPTGKEHTPPTGRQWAPAESTFDQMLGEGRIWFGKSGNNFPRAKQFLSEIQQGIVPLTLWKHEQVGHTQQAKQEFNGLMDRIDFETPKPVRLIDRMLHIAESKSADTPQIVLDFFAGSGSTGHAVYERNFGDSGARKFILVQLPEPTTIGGYVTIADITKERLRRAATKIGAAHAQKQAAAAQLSLENEAKTAKKPLDLGFKVFKLDTSNIRAWNPDPDALEDTLMAHTEHLAAGRTEADVLYEVLLKQGLDLALTIERQVIAGHAVHSVGAGALLVCLARVGTEAAKDYESLALDSIKAMGESTVTPDNAEALALGIAHWHTQLAAALGQTPAELHTRVVLRDSLFGPLEQADVAKTNLTAILRQRGLEDVRSL